MADDLRYFGEASELKRLLLRACPPVKQTEGGEFIRKNGKLVRAEEGAQSIPILAETLNISRQAVEKWIANERIPARRVNLIVHNSGGRVSRDDFFPYVF